MGSKRTLILVAAALIGAIAAYAIYTYVNGIEDRAYRNADRVQVWVVAQDIKANSPGTDVVNSKLITAKQIPLEFKPATAIPDPQVISGKFAKTDLVAGQVVVTGMFVDQSEVVSTWSESLPADRVAVTVSLDQVRSVAGLLQPRDRVMLMVSVDPSQAQAASGKTSQDGGAQADTSDTAVRVLYHNVEILAVGQSGPGAATAAAGASGQQTATQSGLITFSVPPEAAERIVLAGSQLYLALEPKDFTPSASEKPVDWKTIFDGTGASPYSTTTTTKKP